MLETEILEKLTIIENDVFGNPGIKPIEFSYQEIRSSFLEDTDSDFDSKVSIMVKKGFVISNGETLSVTPKGANYYLKSGQESKKKEN